MTATHEATMRVKRRRPGSQSTHGRVEVNVKCSCGAGQFFVVGPCHGPKCQGHHHVRAAIVTDRCHGVRLCPVLVLVLRHLDDTFTRETTEQVLQLGLPGSG